MKELVVKCRKYFIISLLVSFLFFSCDENQNSIIPYVPFSFTVNLNIVNELTVSGNSVLFPNVGFGGVVVYCEVPGSYYAFDAACTYEVSPSCQVQNEGVLAECPCCGSQFILISGAYPSKGPAEMPLKQYNVSVLSNNQLRVYN